MLNHLNIKEFLSQGECQYLAERESSVYAFSVVGQMPPEAYESIISEGFRRNGLYFYQNICPKCNACVPIRVRAQEFRPSKSHRRILRKNQDVRIVRNPVGDQTDGYHLYRKYCRHRHHSLETYEDYKHFLVDSPLPGTEMVRYYVEDDLMGIGWMDVLPNSLSSVYFAFDPDFSDRSPGVYSLLKELELCKELGKEWLQLGFWIKDNPKMSYKIKYTPCELLIGGKWRKAEELGIGN